MGLPIRQTRPLSALAQLVDGRSQPILQEGYVAERHPLMPTLILVWAPCGCVWVGDNEDNFITPCGRADCTFVWHEAAVALSALRAAEQQLPAPTEQPALTIAPLSIEDQAQGGLQE